MTEIIAAFKAMSDPTRLKILELLKNRALTATEIDSQLTGSFANTSQHLKTLLNCNLITQHQLGLYRVYLINGEMINNQIDWLAGICPSGAQTKMMLKHKLDNLRST